MAIAKPGSRRQTPNPASTAPAATSDSTGHHPRALWASAAFSFCLLVALGGRDRAVEAVACVAFAHLYLLLLLWLLRRLQSSPPGSVARHRARLAVSVLSATLNTSVGWKATFALMPAPFGIMAWMVATGIIGLAFYACTSSSCEEVIISCFSPA